MKKLIILIVLIVSIITMSGCNGDDVVPDIYTTIYPIEYIVKNIVEDDLVVKSIYPRGKDVHDYELSPRDMVRISKSKLIFYIGAGLEGLIEQSLNSTLKDVITVPLSEGLDLVEINAEDVHNHGSDDSHHEHEEGVFFDPHIWLDLDKMQDMTSKVLSSILANFNLTSEQAAKFSENARDLKQEFAQLDQEYFDVVNSEDIASKTILVDHDAYIYWEVRYGIERIRIRNDNESTDTIPKDMMEKIQLARSKNIKYICLTANENEVPSAIAKQYKSQLGLGDDAFSYLHHLGTITAEEEKMGKDYLSLMRDNLAVLEKVLPRK